MITLSCPAKINVFLEVRGKRPDGYHELETVMLRTQFADQLTIRPIESDQLTLRFSDATSGALRAGIPMDERNLILKAADAVRKKTQISSGAEFILHKRIPPESGLGGGSSNAATALLLCRKLWQPDLPDDILHEIAASLGSDINFLLSGHAAAVCRGRGEIIEPITGARGFAFVALRPRSGNSTAQVFQATQQSGTLRSSERLVETLTRDRAGDLQAQIFNRLTTAAKQTNAEMAALMARLQGVLRRPVFMSGSGSTVFVVATGISDAKRIQTQIRETMHRSSWLLETVSEAS
jgi:4-diphosphocytidyl-2-C-methyl-D-erythritol kinase